ncbi:MAG: hypothetical protein LQ349_001079 [Xanthoria aureola]|nr:MAG: hypothetical protein LQ349_001079 [Xanthoria aureola]
MHPKIAFLILSAFAAMTMAAPQNPTETPADVEGAITAQDIAQALPVGTVHQLADGEPEVSIAAVERTHVKVCKDINFRGRCETLTANKQRCYDLFNGWSNEISAFGPERGTSCTIYDNRGCYGPEYAGIRYPGISDLRRVGWNDRASSYRCV